MYLGYNGTSNSSRVNLQLLKSYKDVNGHKESVSWLKEHADFGVSKHFFTITAEIHAHSLANFYCQYADRHMNLKFL